MDQNYNVPPERAEWQMDQLVSQPQRQAEPQMQSSDGLLGGQFAEQQPAAPTPVRMSRHKMQAGC